MRFLRKVRYVDGTWDANGPDHASHALVASLFGFGAISFPSQRLEANDVQIVDDGDPLERLQEEVASVLSTTARRFSLENMEQEGKDFGRRLREVETTDEQGESKTNFRRLQDFASTLGFELRHLV